METTGVRLLPPSTGRRKESVARVQLVPGSGTFAINDRVLEDYFPRLLHRSQLLEPFEVSGMLGKFDTRAKVKGGGPSGQAGALRLAISRAIVTLNPELRSTLKRAGLLTRDARAVERKKYGRHKARKRFQHSKR